MRVLVAHYLLAGSVLYGYTVVKPWPVSRAGYANTSVTMPTRVTRWSLCFLVLTLSVVCISASKVPVDSDPESNDTNERLEAGNREVVEEREDDGDLQANEPAIMVLQERLARLKKTEEEMTHQRKLMEHKLDLIRRVRVARNQLAIKKVELSDAINELESRRKQKDRLLEKKQSTYEEKEAIAARRRETEGLIQSMKVNAMTATERTEALAKIQKNVAEQQKAMEQKREESLMQLKALGREFKEQGLEKWIKYNAESLPVIVKGSIEKATEAFAPLADKLESVADAKSMLTMEVSNRLHHILPKIKESPFYEGILFYVMLLFPTVLATWLVLKIHARLSQLTVAHYVVAINLYFATMSVLCLFMSLLSRNDILIVFRHRSQPAFEAFTLLHALLFVLHLGLHAVVAYVSKSSKDLGQFISIFCVGLHFFVHAYKRTIFNQDPNIGSPAYFLYSIIFCYTLYDRGLTIVDAALNDSLKATRRPSESFTPLLNTTSTSLSETRVPIAANNKKTVYFAGLPVFEANSGIGQEDPKNS